MDSIGCNVFCLQRRQGQPAGAGGAVRRDCPCRSVGVLGFDRGTGAAGERRAGNVLFPALACHFPAGRQFRELPARPRSSSILGKQKGASQSGVGMALLQHQPEAPGRARRSSPLPRQSPAIGIRTTRQPVGFLCALPPRAVTVPQPRLPGRGGGFPAGSGELSPAGSPRSRPLLGKGG